MDLAAATLETFTPLIGTAFALPAHGIPLELVAADAYPAPPGDRGRAPFNLLFRGPADPILPQATYALNHPDLGAFAIFIVPVGRDDRGTRYEAVFT